MTKDVEQHGIEIHEVPSALSDRDTEAQNRALDELDEASFDWGTVKIIMIAGCGFVADQYNLFAV